MRISAVLFDLDGTLHDRAQGIAAFASDQFDRLGVETHHREDYVQRFIELDAGGMVWKDQVYKVLRNEFTLKGCPSVEVLLSEYLRLYPGFSVEISDALDTINALKMSNYLVAIVTNGPANLQRDVIEALGFTNSVDAIVISEEVGFKKPQREIFKLALDRLGVQANSTVMVGDSLTSDIEGAIAAGMVPIAFKISSVPNGVLACDTMKEVLQAIEAKRNAGTA